MIGTDLDPWTEPVLFAYYDDEFDEEFLSSLCESLDDWEGVRRVKEAPAVAGELAEDGRTELATGFGEMDVSLWVQQPGESGRDLASLAVRDAVPSNLDGSRWFDFVVGLYRRSVAVGRRPVYTVVTRDSGRYSNPPFSEQSIRSGDVHELGWIHVFTPGQVETLDRDRVLAAPATRVEALDDRSVALGLTLGDDDERRRVSEHLGIAPPVGSDWFDDLDHEVDYVRHRAAREVRSQASGNEVGKRELLDHLDAEDAHVRFVLTRALHHVQGDDVESALRRLALSDESEAVRSRAVDALGSDDVEREALWDDSPKVQYAAVSELERCPDDVVLERLVELLDSDYFQTRREAAERILSDRFVGGISGERVQSARRALADHSDHEDSVIRRRAIEAAARLPASDYDDRVTAALQDESPAVRIAAAERYPDVRGDVDPAVDGLMEIVDGGEHYAGDAAEVLSRIAPRRALLELVPRLNRFPRDVRRDAVAALESVVDERGDSWTRSALETVEPAAIEAAATAVENTDRGEQLEGALDHL